MKKQVQKIMIHINSLGKGGAERVASLLASRFVLDGIQVVVATEWTEDEEYEVDARVRRIHAGLKDAEENSGRIAKLWYRIKNLRNVILEEKPDVILSFCVKANYRAVQAAMGTGIPVIVSVRNDPKVDYVGKAKAVMNKLFLNRANGCVFQTEEAKEFFDEVLQEKSRIICNPVNEKYLKAERKTPREKVVYVGRLVEQKNPMFLVNAFEEIIQKYPKYQLYLYGDNFEDECKEELHRYLEKPEKKEISAHVHFMGRSDRLEIEMADAAMFVLPSDYEGMPNALMEAMALGLPVISTDCPCGGSRYWIEPGVTGQLVGVRNLGSMVQAMEYYIQHPKEAEKMGQQAREKLQEATLEKVYLQWKTYIEEVTTGAKVNC